MNQKQPKHGKIFWQDLPQPFFCLAPMYDVTDTVFRQIICTYSQPDVIFTEFVSADGLAHPIGREKLMHHLWFDKSECRGGKTKIVAQIFGATPENFRTTATLISGLGFDGIDINMGCPEKNIQKQNACAALIGHPDLAREIIQATKEGSRGLPVSVKTRIGYEDIDQNWIETLLGENLAALTVHLRTQKEMSDVPAHWELMSEIIRMRNRISPHTPIVGNGDVSDIADGKKKIDETGCNGIMLGRAVFGNPWLFDKNKTTVSPKEKLRAMVEHTELYEKTFTGVKNFAIMKKHYKAYCNGFPQASTLRVQLMEAENATEVKNIIEKFLKE